MSATTFHKNNPYFASIKERYVLSKAGSQKKTHHITLDLSNSNITYEVGDSIGIYPHHDPKLVEKTLIAMKAVGNEEICLKDGETRLNFKQYLFNRSNITEISPKLFKEVCERQTNLDKKQQLEELLRSENRDSYKKHIGEREVWDFLIEHSEIHFKPQEYIDLLMPLLPRFYSIASSLKYVNSEVHLTVAPLEYEANGHMRYGVCTHYLCNLASLNEPTVPLFIQPSHGFRLPEEHQAPMIMIGPGTGVAPFRAFMQERVANGSQAKHWLFFGEKNRDYDFFYEEFWKELMNRGVLKFNGAFSRDYTHKIYVQHKMEEHGEEIYCWLQEGAYVYVCGDAKQMAKDVDAMLHQIVQKHGRMDETTAKQYIKQLRAAKRYQRDVY